MKPSPLTDPGRPAWVLTADQIGSRASPDLVPAALSALAAIPAERGFERTAGDEIQGVLRSGADVVAALRALVRLDGWRIGVGGGPVERPLPASTRAGRGPAFVAAREALGASRRAPGRIALRLAAGPSDGKVPASKVTDGHVTASNVTTSNVTAGNVTPSSLTPLSDGGVVGGDGYRRAHDPETLLWLLADVWRRRSREGWAVVDLFADGLNGQEAARMLGITPSAVSQRAAAARWVEGGRAEELAARVLDESLSTHGFSAHGFSAHGFSAHGFSADALSADGPSADGPSAERSGADGRGAAGLGDDKAAR